MESHKTNPSSKSLLGQISSCSNNVIKTSSSNRVRIIRDRLTILVDANSFRSFGKNIGRVEYMANESKAIPIVLFSKM